MYQLHPVQAGAGMGTACGAQCALEEHHGRVSGGIPICRQKPEAQEGHLDSSRVPGPEVARMGSAPQGCLTPRTAGLKSI